MKKSANSYFFRYSIDPLTFTIGWLKRTRSGWMSTRAARFNFHHRVVETRHIKMTPLNIKNFNFHHRVVETIFLRQGRLFRALFNFHHRVVETRFLFHFFCLFFSLTFTIGWLKPYSSDKDACSAHSLTFTIGWLKLSKPSWLECCTCL